MEAPGIITKQEADRGSFDPMDYALGLCQLIVHYHETFSSRVPMVHEKRMFHVALQLQAVHVHVYCIACCRDYGVLCIWIEKWYEATLVHIDDTYNPETVKVQGSDSTASNGDFCIEHQNTIF